LVSGVDTGSFFMPKTALFIELRQGLFFSDAL